MTEANDTEIYHINVSHADSGKGITYGGGSIKVLAYLTNAAVKALGALGEAKVSVSVRHGDATLVSLTADADTAAMVLKGKVQKVRKAAGDTGAEDAPAE